MGNNKIPIGNPILYEDVKQMYKYLANQYMSTTATGGKPAAPITSSSATLSTTLTYITLPDGYYSIQALNNFLQNIFILNNCYATVGSAANSNLKYVYFAEFTTVSNAYGVAINTCSFINNSNTLPEGTNLNLLSSDKATKSSYSYSFQIQFYSGFGGILGFPDNVSYGGALLKTDIQTQVASGQVKMIYYPSLGISYLSTLTPNVNPISCYVI